MMMTLQSCSWLYIPRIKNIKIRNKMRFLVRQTRSKRKIVTYTSPLYSTFELLKICPQNTVQGPHCAESDLQVVKFATQQRQFGLYRPVTEPGRVAENINKLQKGFLNAADFLQICSNTDFLFCFCFVSLVWTRS